MRDRAGVTLFSRAKNIAPHADCGQDFAMPFRTRKPKGMSSYQVTVAGEAYGAVLFSQAGYDVSVQYGTTQPGWDFIAIKGGRTLRVSVKGSQDGGWGLFQNYKKGRTFHEAVDTWRKKCPEEVVFLLVQFQGVPTGGAPRSYGARPDEIVAHMRMTWAGHGQTCLNEDYTYSSGAGAGYNDVIPTAWRATKKRIDSV